MKGVVFVMLIAGIFAAELPPAAQQHAEILPAPGLTRESRVGDDISMLPIPETFDHSVYPPTRDIPQQKFNFPQEEVGTHQQQPLSVQPQPQQNIPTSIGCTKNYDPLCGSNGKTYNNICEFSQAKRSNGLEIREELTVAHRGAC